MRTEHSAITLVTGGARGLGSFMARRLAEEGHVVVINYQSSEAGASALERELGKQCLAVRADVSVKKEVDAMAELIGKTFGRLDNLINNAGVSLDGLLVRCREEDWQRVFDVNLKGCFHCTRAVFPLMGNAGGGHVVNISSFSGVKGRGGQAAYSASKAALIGLGMTLAREMAEHNIRVNTVLPGYMETAMGEGSPQALERAEQESIMHRLSDPREVADFIAFLCSTKGITGQVFSLESRIV